MVKASLDQIRERIASAAKASGRNPKEVRLVVVTKGVPVERIREAMACGVEDLGENRVQEAQEKHPLIGRVVRWHMIGHLQRNKVKPALHVFDWIHSVDRLELAEALQRRADSMDRSVEVLIEINAARLSTRFGVFPEDVEILVEQIRRCPRLHLQGLMTMAPPAEDPETVRPLFRHVRELAQRLKLPGLSMGMSQDFEVAIQEGATVVRIGTAIFGDEDP